MEPYVLSQDEFGFAHCERLNIGEINGGSANGFYHNIGQLNLGFEGL